jgi:tetratricopeptide (TPR) repeat protein
MTNQPTPSLNVADLLTRYLERQTESASQGLGFADLGDATPYDATPMQPVEPRQAWQDAVAVAHSLPTPATTWDVPPAWPTLVAQQEPAVAIAFSLGNYPQIVRHVHPLLSGEPTALRQETSQPAPAPDLIVWVGQAKTDSARLLAAGVLRLARHFDRAAELLDSVHDSAWSAARDNEAAALAWHRGQPEKALSLWLAQEPRPAVLFNRGMALLFLGHKAEAVEPLAAAVAALPETSAWHHLASLYLTLARAG